MTPAAQWAVGASAVGVLVAAALLAWMTARGEPTKPDPESTSLVALGKAIYTQHCASCHGANLEGQPNWRKPLPNGRLPAPPHDRTGHTWHHPAKQLFDMVKNGTAAMMPGYETDMPAYKDILSDADIWAVISFIESTWAPDIRERQERMNRRNQ
jgi:mono/diheme cytochrome c family protein